MPQKRHRRYCQTVALRKPLDLRTAAPIPALTADGVVPAVNAFAVKAGTRFTHMDALFDLSREEVVKRVNAGAFDRAALAALDYVYDIFAETATEQHSGARHGGG